MYGYIYKIENTVNGKLYIGQTTSSFKRRKTQHLSDLRHTRHGNCHLQNSFNKYGEFIFDFKILNWANSLEELNNLETYYMKKYDCFDREKGYNIREGGDNRKHSKESLIRMSIAQKGRTISPEHRQKLSLAFKGRKHTLETRQKMSIAHKGNTYCLGNSPSAETRQKMSEAHKGEKSHWYGKNFSLEHRRKLCENHARPMLGKKLSISRRRELSKNNYRRGGGVSGFPGAYLNKKRNHEKKCWYSKIMFNGKSKSLWNYPDPLSASIVFEFVRNEIYEVND
ncbi:MAG: NUMOD3 domain-containing DNA-binding protein [Methanobacteriaceae archaeon]|nr:NUMOD3 domain-containing DNA-binding protein [Methanobacteriaceae archaeon]